MASGVLCSLFRVACRASTGSRHAPKRAFHSSRPVNAILMPAVSPLMTEGTVAEWKKREGEAFSAGDILVQIHYECGFTSLDVRAELPGVLGKILTPDGTTDVPVEQVIALVAKGEEEFSRNQFLPTPPIKPHRRREPICDTPGSITEGVVPSPNTIHTRPEQSLATWSPMAIDGYWWLVAGEGWKYVVPSPFWH
ncbi:hypothetical protein L218DRAFT_1082054 [Marasmius fiardii PR-910]|nr:hypothetical protein L218DRAFT_1082054 [Marasmius fiardii PR-910]